MSDNVHVDLRTVTKIALSPSVEIKEEWLDMFNASTSKKVTEESVTYSWSSDAWDSLGWEDMCDFHEWTDSLVEDEPILDSTVRLGLPYQAVYLAKDDNYLLSHGNPNLGIKVAFIEE